MIAPEFPSSPLSPETKGEVGMVSEWILLRVRSLQFQAWMETDSKEIRLFVLALQHSLQLPFETRNMHSGVLQHLSAPRFLWKNIKWRNGFVHGLLYLLSIAENHYHDYSTWIFRQNTFVPYQCLILSFQITTNLEIKVTIKCGRGFTIEV